MASILRFDNWQNSDGTSIATTDASGNISFAGAGAGKILQVVSTFKNDIFSTTSSTYVDVTGLSVTITPTSASSKVFITGVVSMSGSNAADTDIRLVRDSTAVFAAADDQIFNYRTNQTLTTLAFPLSFLDSPSTTSATTYKIQVKSGGTAWINTRFYDTNRSVSAITVMEVSA